MLLFSSCLKEEDKVIPKGKLAKIYAEMLLTDQWIQDTPGIRYVADTSLIYEPILEKYGYDKMDYLHTVDRYLDDPERFSRIWRETSDILDARLKEAKKRRAALDDVEARIRERENMPLTSISLAYSHVCSRSLSFIITTVWRCRLTRLSEPIVL